MNVLLISVTVGNDSFVNENGICLKMNGIYSYLVHFYL